MNKLLQKLHANKVNMRITPFDLYVSDKIHIRFERGICRKNIEIDLKHLFACEVNAEDILILEMEAFLKEAGLNVIDTSNEEEPSVIWPKNNKFLKGEDGNESL